jgi:hypothetical protein
MKTTILIYTAYSTHQMVTAVSDLVTRSCWFEVTPWPDDMYQIVVKHEGGMHVLDLPHSIAQKEF